MTNSNTTSQTPQSDVGSLSPAGIESSHDEQDTLSKVSRTLEALTKDVKSTIAKYIREPLSVSTPKEKIMKRPDGFDYVESSWMDKQFKEFSPLYDVKLVHHSESLGWIDIIVSVTDKITGNTELGAGSARIQVRRGVENPGFGDVVDKGNNLTAALSKAIKNAQSRFGHAADVYGKRQEVPSDDERSRFEQMLQEIKSINKTRAYTFEEQWSVLGTDFEQYLDNWQGWIDRQVAKSTSESNVNKQSIL